MLPNRPPTAPLRNTSRIPLWTTSNPLSTSKRSVSIFKRSLSIWTISAECPDAAALVKQTVLGFDDEADDEDGLYDEAEKAGVDAGVTAVDTVGDVVAASFGVSAISDSCRRYKI